MTVALYEFLGVRKGFGRVWVTIYIYIAVPKVVRVWHFTVQGIAQYKNRRRRKVLGHIHFSHTSKNIM